MAVHWVCLSPRWWKKRWNEGIDPQDMGNRSMMMKSVVPWGALISDKAHGVESTLKWGAKLTNYQWEYHQQNMGISTNMSLFLVVNTGFEICLGIHCCCKFKPFQTQWWLQSPTLAVGFKQFSLLTLYMQWWSTLTIIFEGCVETTRDFFWVDHWFLSLTVCAWLRTEISWGFRCVTIQREFGSFKNMSSCLSLFVLWFPHSLKRENPLFKGENML